VEASYRTFRTPNELGRRVREDLATLLSERASRLPARGPRTLPVAATSLVGREQAIARPDPGTPGRTSAPG
jgi:hypothetical protein